MTSQDQQPEPIGAREGQVEFRRTGGGRLIEGAARHAALPFRPYRWMDPARERARRALPESLRALLPKTTATGAG